MARKLNTLFPCLSLPFYTLRATLHIERSLLHPQHSFRASHRSFILILLLLPAAAAADVYKYLPTDQPIQRSPPPDAIEYRTVGVDPHRTATALFFSSFTEESVVVFLIYFPFSLFENSSFFF
jgi:hypothetical protein